MYDYDHSVIEGILCAGSGWGVVSKRNKIKYKVSFLRSRNFHSTE